MNGIIKRPTPAELRRTGGILVTRQETQKFALRNLTSWPPPGYLPVRLDPPREQYPSTDPTCPVWPNVCSSPSDNPYENFLTTTPKDPGLLHGPGPLQCLPLKKELNEQESIILNEWRFKGEQDFLHPKLPPPLVPEIPDGIDKSDDNFKTFQKHTKYVLEHGTKHDCVQCKRAHQLLLKLKGCNKSYDYEQNVLLGHISHDHYIESNDCISKRVCYVCSALKSILKQGEDWTRLYYLIQNTRIVFNLSLIVHHQLEDWIYDWLHSINNFERSLASKLPYEVSGFVTNSVDNITRARARKLCEHRHEIIIHTRYSAQLLNESITIDLDPTNQGYPFQKYGKKYKDSTSSHFPRTLQKFIRKRTESLERNSTRDQTGSRNPDERLTEPRDSDCLNFGIFKPKNKVYCASDSRLVGPPSEFLSEIIKQKDVQSFPARVKQIILTSKVDTKQPIEVASKSQKELQDLRRSVLAYQHYENVQRIREQSHSMERNRKET